MNYLVRTQWGWVMDWDDHDRPIYTDARDDAFEFGGLSAQVNADKEARLLDGVVIPAWREGVAQ